MSILISIVFYLEIVEIDVVSCLPEKRKIPNQETHIVVLLQTYLRSSANMSVSKLALSHSSPW